MSIRDPFQTCWINKLGFLQKISAWSPLTVIVCKRITKEGQGTHRTGTKTWQSVKQTEVSTHPAGLDTAPTPTGTWEQPHTAACHWLTWPCLGCLCRPPVSAVELTETCTDHAMLQIRAKGLVTNPKQLPFLTELPPASSVLQLPLSGWVGMAALLSDSQNYKQPCSCCLATHSNLSHSIFWNLNQNLQKDIQDQCSCVQFRGEVFCIFIWIFFSQAVTAIAKSAQERFNIIICHLSGCLIPPEWGGKPVVQP